MERLASTWSGPSWASSSRTKIAEFFQYWKNSAIFVLEDDAQDGPDHVDARRSILLAISPYTRRHAVSHRAYSTVSVLRTINQILALGSLTYFDDRASSLLDEFRDPPAS